METRVLTTLAGARAEADAVREAAGALARGELVVFPTETVYGLGASAASPRAIEALKALKGRSAEKPFTLHLADPDQAEHYAGTLGLLARRLIRKAWPGPLTLVLPDRREPAGRAERAAQREHLIEDCIYVNGTVGLRCPSHPVGRAVLRAAGVPVAASSANLAGRPPPRQAAEALADLAGKVPLVVDAGPTPYARASTVVQVRDDGAYAVLREGAVTAHRVARLARTRLLFVCTGNLCRSPMAVGLARALLGKRLGCDPALPASQLATCLEENGFDLASAGTGAAGGLPPSRHALDVMAARGLDIRDHVSRPVTVDDLLAADYIYVMARAHGEAVRSLAPEGADRVALLDPAGREIEDPMGGDQETYEACARRIEEALAVRLAEVL